jgi:hypothetical protein
MESLLFLKKIVLNLKIVVYAMPPAADLQAGYPYFDLTLMVSQKVRFLTEPAENAEVILTLFILWASFARDKSVFTSASTL